MRRAARRFPQCLDGGRPRLAFHPATVSARWIAGAAQDPSSPHEALVLSWDALEVRAVLKQTAETGFLEDDLLQRLRAATAPAVEAMEESAGPDGTGAEDAVEADEVEGAAEGEDEGSTEPVLCELGDFVLTAELCQTSHIRDFVLLAQLGDRICTPEVQKMSPKELLRIASAFSGLGLLHPPLFTSLAQALLVAWPEGKAPATPELAVAARAMSAQRYRHEELFGRIASHLRSLGAEVVSPPDALSLLHSHAALRLGGPGEMDGELGEELWCRLEEQVLADTKLVGPEGLTELCYVLFLARRVDEERGLPLVKQLLEKASPDLLKRSDAAIAEQPALHRRLLLLRSAMRYLHREAYKDLTNDVQHIFRKVHRMEPPKKELRPVVSFTRKLSKVLTKLKIGHLVKVDRGPFTLDIVERDRKLVYECNHFDRFYTHSIEKVAAMCLQERIVKAMGYKVVQVPHWQWNRIQHRRQRMEYIRMSRYYAVKDRRELAPRDAATQDVAVNDLDFLGEYFFRKDMPLASWSWFSPRYDASKRLPSSGTTTGSL